MQAKDFETKPHYGFRKVKYVAGLASALLAATSLSTAKPQTVHASVNTDSNLTDSRATGEKAADQELDQDYIPDNPDTAKTNSSSQASSSNQTSNAQAKNVISDANNSNTSDSNDSGDVLPDDPDSTSKTQAKRDADDNLAKAKSNISGNQDSDKNNTKSSSTVATGELQKDNDSDTDSSKSDKQDTNKTSDTQKAQDTKSNKSGKQDTSDTQKTKSKSSTNVAPAKQSTSVTNDTDSAKSDNAQEKPELPKSPDTYVDSDNNTFTLATLDLTNNSANTISQQNDIIDTAAKDLADSKVVNNNNANITSIVNYYDQDTGNLVTTGTFNNLTTTPTNTELSDNQYLKDNNWVVISSKSPKTTNTNGVVTQEIDATVARTDKTRTIVEYVEQDSHRIVNTATYNNSDADAYNTQMQHYNGVTDFAKDQQKHPELRDYQYVKIESRQETYADPATSETRFANKYTIWVKSNLKTINDEYDELVHWNYKVTNGGYFGLNNQTSYNSQNLIDLIRTEYLNSSGGIDHTGDWQLTDLSDGTLANGQITIDEPDNLSHELNIDDGYKLDSMTIRLYSGDYDKTVTVKPGESYTPLDNDGGFTLSMANSATGRNKLVVSSNSVIANDFKNDINVDITYNLVPAEQTATITYVDDDENGKVLETHTLTGKAGETQTIKTNIPTNSHYSSSPYYVSQIIDSKSDIYDSFDSSLNGSITERNSAININVNTFSHTFQTNDSTANLIIHLKHKTDTDQQTVDREYKIVENLPDDNGVTHEKQIGTVTYHAYRNNRVDMVTGKTTYSKWQQSATTEANNGIQVTPTTEGSDISTIANNYFNYDEPSGYIAILPAGYHDTSNLYNIGYNNTRYNESWPFIHYEFTTNHSNYGGYWRSSNNLSDNYSLSTAYKYNLFNVRVKSVQDPSDIKQVPNNQTIYINYEPAEQTSHVTVIDETTGKTLVTGNIVGDIQSSDYITNLHVDDGYIPDYVVSTNDNGIKNTIHFNGSHKINYTGTHDHSYSWNYDTGEFTYHFGTTPTDITIYLKHDTTPINQSVSHTFNIIENLPNSDGTITQKKIGSYTIHATRTGKKDKVTGKVTYDYPDTSNLQYQYQGNWTFMPATDLAEYQDSNYQADYKSYTTDTLDIPSGYQISSDNVIPTANSQSYELYLDKQNLIYHSASRVDIGIANINNTHPTIHVHAFTLAAVAYPDGIDMLNSNAPTVTNYYINYTPIEQDATVTFVDQDTGKTLETDKISGTISNAKTISTRIPKGYELVKYVSSANNYTGQLDPSKSMLKDSSYDTSSDQGTLRYGLTWDYTNNKLTYKFGTTPSNYTIYLEHHLTNKTETQNRTYTIKENAPLAKYNSQVKTYTKDANWTRNVVTDDATGITYYGQWHAPQATITGSKTANKIPGYEAYVKTSDNSLMPNYYLSFGLTNQAFTQNGVTNTHSGFASADLNNNQYVIYLTNGNKDVITTANSSVTQRVLDKINQGIDKAYQGYTLTNSTPDASGEIDVYYEAQPQTVQVVYVDDEENQAPVKSLTINGMTDETVPIDGVEDSVPDNYELVPNQNIPTSYTLTADKNQKVLIHLKHQHTQTSVDRQPYVLYHLQVDGKDINKDYRMETPNYWRIITDTDLVTGKTTTKYQVISFDTDEVLNTDKVSSSDLSKQDLLDIYKTQDAGTYKADKTQLYVDGDLNTAGLKAQSSSDHNQLQIGEHTLNVVQTVFTRPVEFQDVDTGDIMRKLSVTSAKGTQVTISNPDLPLGYELVEPGDIHVPILATKEDNANKPYIVKIKAMDVDVSHDHPHNQGDLIYNDDTPMTTYPDGVTYDDLNRVLTRTINIYKPNGETQTITQQVKLYRDAKFNLQYHTITYTDWKSDGDRDWEAITAPEFEGYTPSQSTVAKVAPDPDDGDVTVDITYNDAASSTILAFEDVDASSTEVARYNYSGDPDTGSGDDIDWYNKLSQNLSNYELVPGQTVLGKTLSATDADTHYLHYTYSDYNKPVVIKVQHKVTDTSDIDPLAKSSVSRKLTIIDPNGNQTVYVQHVDFKRSAKKDLATQLTSYGDWQVADYYVTKNGEKLTTSFDDGQGAIVNSNDPDFKSTPANTDSSVTFGYIDLPQYEGYIPVTDITDVDGNEETQMLPTAKISPAGANSDYVVTYQGHSRTNYYYLVDDDNNGEIVDGYHAFGDKQGDTVKVNVVLPAHYELVNPSEKQLTYTFKNNTPDTPIAIHVKHATQAVTNNTPSANIQKTITRTVTIVNPHDESSTTKEQSVTFFRNAVSDDVTGGTVYTSDYFDANGNAQSSFSEMNIPQIEGYQAYIAYSDDVYGTDVGNNDLKSLSSESVTANNDNINIIIRYKPIQSSIKVTYVDADLGDSYVDSSTISGNYGDPVALSATTDRDIPEGYELAPGQDLNDTYTIGTTQKNITIKLVHKTTNVHETKDLVRTIRFVDQQGNDIQPAATQKVQAIRYGTKDMVTGETHYGEWQNGHYDAYGAPSIQGYHAITPFIPAADADGDATATIVYQKLADPEQPEPNKPDLNLDKPGETISGGVDANGNTITVNTDDLLDDDDASDDGVDDEELALNTSAFTPSATQSLKSSSQIAQAIKSLSNDTQTAMANVGLEKQNSAQNAKLNNEISNLTMTNASKYGILNNSSRSTTAKAKLATSNQVSDSDTALVGLASALLAI